MKKATLFACAATAVALTNAQRFLSDDGECPDGSTNCLHQDEGGDIVWVDVDEIRDEARLRDDEEESGGMGGNFIAVDESDVVEPDETPCVDGEFGCHDTGETGGSINTVDADDIRDETRLRDDEIIWVDPEDLRDDRLCSEDARGVVTCYPTDEEGNIIVGKDL